MKTYFLLFYCSLSFFGTAQSLDTNEKRDKILSDSGYYRTVEDPIGNIKKEDRIRYGVSINQSFTRYGLPTAVLFTIQFKKHQFDLGPQFRLGKSINERQKNIGVEFNYRYYILGDTSWFSSYLLLNVDYFFEYSKPNRYGIYSSDDPALNGQLATSSDVYKNLALNVGYGIKFNLGNGFYLGSHAGIGTCILFKERTISLVNVDWNNTWKRREDNLGFIASVFIGYKF